jgi:hypothetical protein
MSNASTFLSASPNPIGTLLTRATNITGPTVIDGATYLPCTGRTYATADYPEYVAAAGFTNADLVPFKDAFTNTPNGNFVTGNVQAAASKLFTKIGSNWTDGFVYSTNGTTWQLCTTPQMSACKHVLRNTRLYSSAPNGSLLRYTTNGITWSAPTVPGSTSINSSGYSPSEWYQIGYSTATSTTWRIATYDGTVAADVTGCTNGPGDGPTWFAGSGSNWLLGNGTRMYRLGQSSLVGGAVGGVWTALGNTDPALLGYSFLDCVAGKYIFGKVLSADTTVGGGVIQFAITTDGSSFTYREIVVPACAKTLLPAQGTTIAYGLAGVLSYSSSTTVGGKFYLTFQNILITSTDADTFIIEYNFSPLLATAATTAYNIGIDQSGNVRVLAYYYNGSTSTTVYTFTGNTSAPDTFAVRNISEAGRPYYMIKVT